MSMQLAVDEKVFKTFALCAMIVVLKMFFLVFWTVIKRKKHKVFPNPEDAASHKGVVNFNCEEVERVRRCHLNDIENNVPFMMIGFFYMFTHAAPEIAVYHYWAFAIGRIIHLVGYVFLQTHMIRGIGFMTGFIACLSMAVQTIMYFAQ